MDNPTVAGTLWSIVGLLIFLAASFILGVIYVGDRKEMPNPTRQNPYCPFDFEYLTDECAQHFCSDKDILACSRHSAQLRRRDER